MKSDVLPTVISKNFQASLIFLYFYHVTLAACVFLLFPRADEVRCFQGSTRLADAKWPPALFDLIIKIVAFLVLPIS